MNILELLKAGLAAIKDQRKTEAQQYVVRQFEYKIDDMSKKESELIKANKKLASKTRY